MVARSRILSRRSFLETSAAVSLAAALHDRRAFAKNLTIGFLYVGARDDFGFNNSHALAAAALKKMPGVRVVEEENVAETTAVVKSMESMIELDGARLLFPTSYGYYDPHVLKEAVKHPDVRFEHCGGRWTEKHPKNAGSYFAYIDECEYLAGIVAGYASKTGKLGFIGAKPIPTVLRDINALTMGARLVNPKIVTRAVFTGDWSLPVKEAEAANALLDQGVDVITGHVDSPKIIIETAASRGQMSIGYHADQSALARATYLTGAEWNWGTFYQRFVADFMAGRAIPNLVRGGLKEGMVKLSPFGPKVGEPARRHVAEVRTKMQATSFAIFEGPLKDNRGRVAIPSGAQHLQTDPKLESMDYLVDGVLGSVA
jgi:simple sugar transport system substrate-binding protein